MKRDLSLLWRLKKGFTLIEILIAVTILVVVAVALFSTFRGGTAAWQLGTAHAQRNAEARATLEMMTRELSKAILIVADGTYEIDFVAKAAASSIYFIGSLETPRAGQPDLVKVRYDLDERNLRRTTITGPIEDGSLLANFSAIPPPPTATLASYITSLTFEFFDNIDPFDPTACVDGLGDRWRANWDSRTTVEGGVTAETVDTLPDAVRITITSDPEGPEGLAEKTFSTVVELPRAEH